jgi:DNA/RNA non-specific endonuclease
VAPASLPDISSRFKFRTWTQGGYFYKEAAGELGVPGKVATHRDVRAQRDLAGGTGDHAGHMIGVQFGAPGGIENMGLQNANMNTFAPKRLQEAFRGHGGSYHDLESEWARKLKDGYRISVIIQDKYREDEERPFVRWVQWVETTPKGKKEAAQTLDFGNFSSPQLRTARGETPGPVTNGGKGAKVISLFGTRR